MERRARLRRNSARDPPKLAAESFIILEQLQDGKMVKNIFPKIGGRLRLAHEQNQQISITTEIIKYDGNLALVKAGPSTMNGSFPGIGMTSLVRDHPIAEEIGCNRIVCVFRG